MLRRFNIRVYGLLINENDQVLLSDELIKGKQTTKFPGGGLELGEGTVQCIIREMKEECKVDVTVLEHFYTTDFFVQSEFDEDSQILSIYYLLSCPQWQSIATSSKKFDFVVKPGLDAESFRWVDVRALEEEQDILLPIDKVVVELLKAQFPKVGFKIPNETRL